jgi:preprotein translocase subunit YajC
VAELDKDTFILEVEKGGRIKFNKSAISMEATKAANKGA